MQVDINKTVSYEVAKVEVMGVNIGKNADGSMIFMVPYCWLAADGSVIRQNTGRYSAAELTAALGGGQDAIDMMTKIASLFPEGDRPSLSIRTMLDKVVVYAGHNETVDGKPKPVVVQYTDADLTAKGVTEAMIVAVIQQLAVVLV